MFEGEHGYLRLFEGEFALEPVLQSLGRDWRIAELSLSSTSSRVASVSVVTRPAGAPWRVALSRAPAASRAARTASE